MVDLDLDGNGQAGKRPYPTAVAGHGGDYAFGGVAAGTYKVAVDVSSLGGSGPAWQQTSPTTPTRAVTVAAGGFDAPGGERLRGVAAGGRDRHRHRPQLCQGPAGADATPQPGVTVNLLADQLAVAVDAGGGTAGNLQTDTSFPGVMVFRHAPTAPGRRSTPAGCSARPRRRSTSRPGPGPAPTFTYTFLPPTPGRYTVRLHFAELTAGAPGERLFDVDINGRPVLTNYDIFAAAGGLNTAVVEEFTVDTDDHRQIIIAFSAGSAGDPIVNGIEVVQPGACGRHDHHRRDRELLVHPVRPGPVRGPGGAAGRVAAGGPVPLRPAVRGRLPLPPAAAGGRNRWSAADFDGDGFLDLDERLQSPTPVARGRSGWATTSGTAHSAGRRR